MATTAKQPKFTREDPDVRRQALIEATLTCLARDGVEGASVRRICDEAGVSAGLLRHYFGSKDRLIAESYRHVSRELLEPTEAFAAAAELTPHERLYRAIDVSMRPPIASAERLQVRLAFWHIAPNNTEVGRAHRRIRADYLAATTRLVEDAAAADGVAVDTGGLANGLSVMLDGFWLKMVLEPRRYSPKEMHRACRLLLEPHLPGYATVGR